MALKTYLLAPNFTLEPDGPIRIGRVIIDPFRPTKPLHIPTSEPAIATHVDFDSSHSRNTSHSLHGSVFAQFLQVASANVGAGVSKDVLTQYTMDSLETQRIKEDPTDFDAAELVKHPPVQAAINSGVLGSAPVYMITGIKIAKGFGLSTQVVRTREVQSGGSGTVTGDIAVGADVGASRTKGAEDAFRSGSDIIFAYQLHAIAYKKWWRKKLTVVVYAPSSAFLSDDAEAVEDEAAVGDVTPDHVLAIAEENEDDSVKAVDGLDGDSKCVCIAFKDSDDE
ncbi:hypothetical protein BDV95DRAFT_605672 [Massariosphaeria phaeospora]|uniref:Uncharacterized protein n=1 Tax=Massariosphaeria phaeospora TaxID=100035 RepID=A0A7C8IA33_9PLEO|nr:hypothetical protein BDV95DRAFT_605672 [Massariosphaeria phaeospora]